MRRRRRRRLDASAAVVLALACAGTAAADPFSDWSGKRGPFAWEAKLRTCGDVGDTPSRVRAHTRWRGSPANGYQRLTFFRRRLDDDGDGWLTVQRQARSTKNGPLEGNRAVVHWSQWFFPFEDEGGATTRHVVRFEWLRDRPGRDRRVLRRTVTLPACVVSP